MIHVRRLVCVGTGENTTVLSSSFRWMPEALSFRGVTRAFALASGGIVMSVTIERPIPTQLTAG